jgi:hypothetical protein
MKLCLDGVLVAEITGHSDAKSVSPNTDIVLFYPASSLTFPGFSTGLIPALDNRLLYGS